MYPVCKAVHDPVIAVKTLRGKRAMGLFIGCNMVRRQYTISINYLFHFFAKNASSTLSAGFLFLSPQMTQTKRRKRA